MTQTYGSAIRVATAQRAAAAAIAEAERNGWLMPVAVVGSSGLVEVAVRDGDASRTLDLTRGSRVVLRANG